MNLKDLRTVAYLLFSSLNAELHKDPPKRLAILEVMDDDNSLPEALVRVIREMLEMLPSAVDTSTLVAEFARQYARRSPNRKRPTVCFTAESDAHHRQWQEIADARGTTVSALINAAMIAEHGNPR